MLNYAASTASTATRARRRWQQLREATRLDVQPGAANNVLCNRRRRGDGGSGNIKDALPARINPPVAARRRMQLALY